MTVPEANLTTKKALDDFFSPFYEQYGGLGKNGITRDGLAPHIFPIPFLIADGAVADVEFLWTWILTQIPPDSIPHGVVHAIRNGEYADAWDVVFTSEAFGKQTLDGTLSGGKLCLVDIDYFNYPKV